MSEHDGEPPCPCTGGRHHEGLPVNVHVNGNGRLFQAEWRAVPRAPDALEVQPASLPLF